MKLFSAVNRKIKFREKDYVENNYIREDGKAVIPIELKSIDELYMPHDYEKLVLSDEISNYIKEVASIIHQTKPIFHNRVAYTIHLLTSILLV